MSTLKIVLRRKPNKDGSFPLCLRVTKDRKTSFIHLGYSLQESEWDAQAQRVKRSHPNSVRLNNFLAKKLTEATDTALELESHKKYTTSKAVVQKINPKVSNSFMAQAKIHLSNLEKTKNFNRWTNESSLFKNFKKFLPGGDIGFEGITSTLLKQFAAHLKFTGNNVSETHIMNHMVVIRLVYNQAIDAGLVDEKFYPFGRRKFKVKFPETTKIGLTASEVKTLEDANFADPRLHHSRNLFLFSFYFAGMRISDVFRLRWSDFKDGRLYYVMGKNGKAGSLKVPAKATAIMEQYSRPNPKHDLVFPDIEGVEDYNDEWEVKKKIKSSNRRLNERLDSVRAGIKLTKKLDPHIARHTFGNISGDKISLKTLKQLYRHFHLSTTANYQQNFTHDEMDNALDAVLEEVAVALAA
ncbi:integrase [Niastella koreensis]|uniref:Integrase family protein n=2 Tax=Niastella koreensis TaxID=354356 RepID=G8TJF8_NIAKG|nr:site-specific integrase [Niastella koreensis]AEV99693.1 integrase family protein [Niastella koreensis GR20-10]OQP44279.1 integrase [Niastella koreensis]